MTATPSPRGDWEPAELEHNGRALLARIRTHLESIREQPVTTAIGADALLEMFTGPVPEHPEPFLDVLDDTWAKVVPHLTQWHHPSFHAYFSHSTSGPGILGELLTATLNVNGMLWQSAPAAAAVEKTVLAWIAEMTGYPPDADAVLVTGASLATFYALAAARDALTGLKVREGGMAGGPRLRLYTSDQAHSSVEKAAIALGVGTDNVVLLATGDDGRMPPAALERAIRHDIDHGMRPFAAVATVGTTATGAIDPLPQIAQVCRAFGVWLHVDAAYGGLWRLADTLRPHLENLRVADSMVVNAHKVLFCPMEASALYCRHPRALENTFRLVPEYLRVPDDAGAVDYMNHSLQLGRQFRALKIWWTIRTFGRTGLAERLTHSVELADWLRAQAERHPSWDLPAPSVLPLVCLRYQPGRWPHPAMSTAERSRWTDTLNEEILHAVTASRTALISHAVTTSGYVLRVSIGNIQTTRDDIEHLWNLLNTVAADCQDRLLAQHSADHHAKPQS